MNAVEECYESSPSSYPLDWQLYLLLQTQCFGCPVICGCDRTHAQMGRHNGSMEYAEEYCCTPTSQMHWRENILQSTDPDSFRTLGAYRADEVLVRKFLRAKWHIHTHASTS